jgi:hypothetical protein
MSPSFVDKAYMLLRLIFLLSKIYSMLPNSPQKHRY